MCAGLCENKLERNRQTENDSKGDREIKNLPGNLIISNSLTSVNTSVNVTFLLWPDLHERKYHI